MKLTLVGLLAVLLTVIGGCAFTGPVGDLSQALRSGSIGDSKEGLWDDPFAEVAQRVPAFGGMFFDDQGVLNVYLLGLSQRGAVEEAITAVFGSEAVQGGIRVLQGQYGFLQLTEWHNRISAEVLGLPGVVLTDVDDAKNRLTIGVEELQRVQSQIEELLARLGIPREAVIIEETGPVVFERGGS